MASPFTPQEIAALEEANPFKPPSPIAEPEGLGSRALGAFGRLIRLPLGLVGEALQLPLARQQQASFNRQRELAEQLLGPDMVQDPSTGRRVANMLSLGLVPGQNTQINPEGLTLDERERFDKLTPLQQRILTARNPEDFAELINDDAAFGPVANSPQGQIGLDVQQGIVSPEDASLAQSVIQKEGEILNVPGEAPVKNERTAAPFVGSLGPLDQAFEGGKMVAENTNPANVSNNAALMNPQTGEVTRNQGPVTVGKGAAVLQPDPDSATGLAETFKNEETFSSRIDPNKALETFTPESVQAFVESQGRSETGEGDFRLLKPDPARQEAALAAVKKKAKSGEFKDRLSLTREYNSEVAPYKQLGDRYRGILGSFGADPGTIPPLLAQDFEKAGIDVSGLSASGIRDVAMIFGFMKILDPPSTVREGEAEMVASARAFGFAERTVQKLLRGEQLSNEQRVEMLKVIRSTMAAKLGGYAVSRKAFLDIAREGGFENPETAVPDYLSDMRQLFQATTDDPNDSELDSLDKVIDLYKEGGGDPDDGEKFKAFYETWTGKPLE